MADNLIEASPSAYAYPLLIKQLARAVGPYAGAGATGRICSGNHLKGAEVADRWILSIVLNLIRCAVADQ